MCPQISSSPFFDHFPLILGIQLGEYTLHQYKPVFACQHNTQTAALELIPDSDHSQHANTALKEIHFVKLLLINTKSVQSPLQGAALLN